MTWLVNLTRAVALAALGSAWSLAGAAQQRDTTALPRPPRPNDSLKVYTLPPAVVSVTRANPPINRVPQAVQLLEKTEISQARPTWGLDEALVTVPGVYAANRYNFSLDQRISIRGFGARSAFAVRGIKVLVDGIPQTLPDGQGQLTNLELGAADRIEILRGSASALFGNASGGVISIWTDPTAPRTVRQDVRVLFGTFDRDLNRTWNKWQSSTSFRVGSGSALVTVSRLDYTGQRQHSDADFRNLNSRWHFPLAPGWSLAATADVGWDPRADNPGALTNNEMRVNRDSAARLNITQVAGKDVTQGQGGVTVRRELAGGGEASLTVFGITRRLKNPTTFAYIDLKRFDYGARFSVSRPVPLGSLEQRLTAGVDFQRQRDDRLNFNNVGGQPGPLRQLDQLEHVTEVGPFIQSALRGNVAGRLNYSVALYQADVRDELIGYQVPSSAGRVFFQNAGTSRHRGIEVGSELEIAAGLNVVTTWTYSDFRYTRYTLGTQVLDGQALPGIPQHWLHFLLQLRPPAVRGAWVEVEETHSSGFTVDDTASTSNAPRTGPWWSTNLRAGWEGTVGSVRLRPFVGFNNVWNRAYVGSVVINAANRRYYEPAPGRNVYVGFSLGAGE